MANPLLEKSPLPYALPDFAAIRFEHFQEAFEHAMAEHRAEVDAIASNPDSPTFENTALALEQAGTVLTRVSHVFFTLASADSTPQLRELHEWLAPRLADHTDALTLDPQLFARLKSVAAEQASSGDADRESRTLVERYVTEMTLAGAALESDAVSALKELNQQLSVLETRFSKCVLEDTNDLAVLFADAAELDGLSESALSACAELARQHGHEGAFLVALTNTTSHPFLALLTNRESRRRIFEATAAKGSRDNAYNTHGIVLELTSLRAQRAALLGFANHAAFAVADQTAATPEAIEQLVYPLAQPAARNARAEAAALQQKADDLADAAGEPRFRIAAWDWAYYTEKVRADRFSIDTAALRPFFEYDRVLLDGVFYAATQLYGITFAERPDLVGYHPDCRIFEVFDGDRSPLGLFIHDVYTRDSKKGGAWMNNLVDQSRLHAARPVICNNLNVPKPAVGEPTLLTLDEVRTMFHEFGHALHGLFSAVTYPKLSGTQVPRDFVEFPSQVNEMWVTWPEVVEHYARHVDTGEPLPQDVLEGLKASSTFNEGFATSEYLASALLDQEWHKLPPDADVTSVAEFEAAALKRVGLDDPLVPPRYRSPYFSHTFAGGYDAGYYSYIWSEVLDADTVEWFTSHGGLTRENGDRFRGELLSRGRSRDPLESYRAFRGRDAEIAPLLTRRGLA